MKARSIKNLFSVDFQATSPQPTPLKCVLGTQAKNILLFPQISTIKILVASLFQHDKLFGYEVFLDGKV